MIRQIMTGLLAVGLFLNLTACSHNAGDVPESLTPPPIPPGISTPNESEPPVVEVIPTDAPDDHTHFEEGQLELPVEGATGYTTIALNLRESPEGEKLATLGAGTAFCILAEQGDWWQVETAAGTTGWVKHTYCMVNLPDVVPSIVYDSINSDAARFLSSGREIPSITGEQLYNALAYNERLGKEQYMMPVLYTMAKKICQAQQNALQEGNSLILYEAYRPYEIQRKILTALTALSETDSGVLAGITSPPWNIAWFINNGVSNHQKGFAIDVGLVSVDDMADAKAGDYTYHQVLEYTEYLMPTSIHELSIASATFTAPVASGSKDAWRDAELSTGMKDCQAAVRLQNYCTDAGLTPLASEWWHFNDLEAKEQTSTAPGEGSFQLEQCLSTAP